MQKQISAAPNMHMVALAGNAYMKEARTHLLMLRASKHVTALNIYHKGEHMRGVTKTSCTCTTGAPYAWFKVQ